ncbi:MAG: SDR family oxidoreductase [Gammaproteobacteria bacterium]|nr:SDR family oxidoreductase [Gammaproteobacteria bacterium]
MFKGSLFATLLLIFSLGSGAALAALDKNTTALVTGANRGIGLELATQLKAMNVNVIGTARNPAAAEQLNALGVRVEQLDVADAASVAALAERLKGVKIDLLINNAGVGGQAANTLADIDFEQLAQVFSINSTGPMRVTQALLPNLTAGSGKTVVQVSSVMGSIAQNAGGYYGYRASKAALNMLNKSLSAELGPQGFTCVVVHPGWVKTRMGGAAAPVEVPDSVAGLLKVIGGLRPEDNGRFIDFQGNEIPW